MGVLLAGHGVVATATSGAVGLEPTAARGGILGRLAAEPELLDGTRLARDDGRLASTGAVVRPAMALDERIAERTLAVAEAVTPVGLGVLDARGHLRSPGRARRARRKGEGGSQESES